MENSQVDYEKASDELEKQEAPMVSKEYYTVSDIAEMVGLSRQRIHQIIDKGTLKPDIITRFEFIFKKKTLDKFVKDFVRRAW
jgi:DNA-binding XRE family transcriptional regulator